MDRLTDNLVPALWLAWVVYWFAMAGNAKPTRRREGAASGLGHMVPLMIAVALQSVPVHRGWLGTRFIPHSLAWFWFGAALVVIGLGFTVWARVHLGRNWSGVVTVKQDHELIRTGPYGLVRHPIYTGLLLAFLGSGITLGEWRGLVAVLLVAYAFIRKLRLEEQWMSEQFPADYPVYRTEVAALIPGIY